MSRQWVIVQLSPLAVKEALKLQLQKEIRRVLKADLEIFYTPPEDSKGKHPDPFSEYLFIEYRERIGYEKLLNFEYFKDILRSDGFFHLLNDSDLSLLAEKSRKKLDFHPEERVKVLHGVFKGSRAFVESVDEEAQILIIKAQVGESQYIATIDHLWCKPLRAKS